MQPTVRIKLNNLTKQFFKISNEHLIISLEILSSPGDFPSFNFLRIFLSSCGLVNSFKKVELSFDIFFLDVFGEWFDSFC